jgi:hypothetical protein
MPPARTTLYAKMVLRYGNNESKTKRRAAKRAMQGAKQRTRNAYS